MGNTTFAIIKPDAVKNKSTGKIYNHIIQSGFNISAAKLINISGGSVAGFIFVINLFDLPGNKLLRDKGYKTESLIEFPGH